MNDKCKDCPNNTQGICCHQVIRPMTAMPRYPTAAQPARKPSRFEWANKTGVFPLYSLMVSQGLIANV